MSQKSLVEYDLGSAVGARFGARVNAPMRLRGRKISTRECVGDAPRRSLGRATQLQRFGSDRCRLRLGLDRLETAGLDPRCLCPCRYFHRTGLVQHAQRTRMSCCAGHQHLRAALMMKVAVSEAHAGHRSAESALVTFVQVEAWLKGNPP